MQLVRNMRYRVCNTFSETFIMGEMNDTQARTKNQHQTTRTPEASSSHIEIQFVVCTGTCTRVSTVHLVMQYNRELQYYSRIQEWEQTSQRFVDSSSPCKTQPKLNATQRVVTHPMRLATLEAATTTREPIDVMMVFSVYGLMFDD